MSKTVALATLADWVVAIATLLLAFVAAFQDRIRRWVMSPRLELGARVRQPDCQKTTWRYPIQRNVDYGPRTATEWVEAPCYYFRVTVTNRGPSEARDVELFAKALRRKRADGTFEDVETFTPMNLLWANFRQPTLSVLSPHMPKMCDLAHVIHPNHAKSVGHELPGVAEGTTLLAFDLQVEPNMKGHLVGPGTYQLDLVLAGSNFSPKKYTLEIQFNGDWMDSEDRMLSDGFGMRLV